MIDLMYLIRSTDIKHICKSPAPSQNPKDPPRSENILVNEGGG